MLDSWTSSKDAPHVIKYLKVGETYTLHEEFAPHGYLVANDVTFTVKDTGEVQKVEMKDKVPVGELIINKKGEFLDSITLADKVKGVVEHIFNYVTGKLTDVTFEVYAEEDIKAADGVSDDYYKKDELIATIKTDETGIAKLENLPSALSGGQQQRVAIARALAAKPAILLADEPTGNLDSKTSQDVLGLLKVTSKRFHQTIVMITHNEEIAQMADRILQIEDGKIVSDSGLV